jgi:hypothetical protein
MSRDPTRLLDDPSTLGELRSDLALAKSAKPPAFDMDHEVARLSAAIGTIGPGPQGPSISQAGTAAAGAAKIAVATKAVLAVAVVGAGVTTYMMMPAREVPPASPQMPTMAPAIAPSPAPTPEPISTAVEAPVAPSATASSVRRAAAPQVVDDTRQEIADLAEAKRALGSDPARALAIVEAARQKYPHGVLGEEREAVGIFALSALGRTAEARTRAASFLSRHPNGPFSEKVRRISDATPR